MKYIWVLSSLLLGMQWYAVSAEKAPNEKAPKKEPNIGFTRFFPDPPYDRTHEEDRLKPRDYKCEIPRTEDEYPNTRVRPEKRDDGD